MSSPGKQVAWNEPGDMNPTPDGRKTVSIMPSVAAADSMTTMGGVAGALPRQESTVSTGNKWGDLKRKASVVTALKKASPFLRTTIASRPTDAGDSSRGSTNSHSGHTDRQYGSEFVDQLLPEDVGFSFCIRAAADFSNGNPKMEREFEGDKKHLFGLTNIFPEPGDDQDTRRSDRFSGIQRAISNISTSVSWNAYPFKRKGTGRVRFAATSLVATRTSLLLSTSAMLSCIFVIWSCAVEASCDHRDLFFFVWLHLANSIMYGLVALPSRCLFSRVDWRIGEELTLPHEVFASHLRSPGFYCDIMAIVGLLAEIAHSALERTNDDPPMPTAAQWIMLLQLFKVWRVAFPEDGSDSHKGFWQGITKLLGLLIAFSHVCGCTFLLVGNFEGARGERSWLDNAPYDLDMTNCVVRYTESFYFAVIGLTSVGYGDLLVTPLEHGVNSFFLLISQLFAAKVCAELTWLTSMYNQHEAATHERRRGILLALEKMAVPQVLVKRVLAFQSYENTMHADNMEKETFQGLGKNLMEELRLCAYRKLVLQAPFLREQPTDVISFIVKSLSDEVYLPADFIVRAGEHGRELFFVRRGEARAYLGPSTPVWGQSNEVATIKAGSYFGELAMLTGLPRGSFVMATSYCICSVLPYSAVEDLVEVHPEAFTTLVQTMVKMYSLKPDTSWQVVSKKMIKKFSLHSCWEAFVWLRGHADSPDDDCLDAKAFDIALNKLRVTHLDRRIFWSNLDADASGMISFEEFRDAVSAYFPDDSEDSPGEACEAAAAPALASRPFLKRTATQVDEGSIRAFGAPISAPKRSSINSIDSLPSHHSLSSNVTPVSSSKRPSVCHSEVESVDYPSHSSSKEGIDIGAMIVSPAGIPDDAARDGAIEALLAQNKSLLEAIQKFRLKGPSKGDNIPQRGNSLS